MRPLRCSEAQSIRIHWLDIYNTLAVSWRGPGFWNRILDNVKKTFVIYSVQYLTTPYPLDMCSYLDLQICWVQSLFRFSKTSTCNIVVGKSFEQKMHRGESWDPKAGSKLMSYLPPIFEIYFPVCYMACCDSKFIEFCLDSG